MNFIKSSPESGMYVCSKTHQITPGGTMFYGSFCVPFTKGFEFLKQEKQFLQSLSSSFEEWNHCQFEGFEMFYWIALLLRNIRTVDCRIYKT